MREMATSSLTGDEPLTRVMALHALGYCERLFYLEEVEEIRIADASVYAGRQLHEQLSNDEQSLTTFTIESAKLGLKGKLDCIRRKDGTWIPYEVKKGRSAGSRAGGVWPSDSLQVSAYAMLLEEHLGQTVREGMIHYRADRRTITFPIDDAKREAVLAAIEQANLLRQSTKRPPVTDNERLCAKCSLAPVCLPEEERFAVNRRSNAPILRYFPERHESHTLHITTPGAHVSKSGERIVIKNPEGEKKEVPIEDLHAIVLHGPTQISTQALHYCASREIPIHWVSGRGYYVGGLSLGAGGIQRRIRQFNALRDSETRLLLARKIVYAKIASQLGYLMRATRGKSEKRDMIASSLRDIRNALKFVENAQSPEALRGYEGVAGRAYFSALPHLLSNAIDTRLVPKGRNRRPPTDPFNALLSFLYTLLYRDVVQAIMVVGLDPSFGLFHTPRSAAYPLALDLQELFRVPLVDIPTIGAINRRHFDADDDFTRAGRQIWLSTEGKKKAIALYEKRKQECWNHPVLKYSLSYARTIELEVRLLEKEWNDAPGLFAKSRLR